MTLIGTGGTGKTRLMIEVAGRVADAVRGRRVAGRARAPRRPGRDRVRDRPGAGRVRAARAGRRSMSSSTFLAVEGAAPRPRQRRAPRSTGSPGSPSGCSRRAPGLRILTTSREALAVAGRGGRPGAVADLPGSVGTVAGRRAAASTILDEAGATEAVALFVERAGAVLPSFALDRRQRRAVAEICRRLDGIPLAIELAAAACRRCRPTRSRGGLGDRFRLLTGGRRTAVPRQQTLHALIDWSWDLLTDADRRLLRRLSIFAGGWTAGRPAADRRRATPDRIDAGRGRDRRPDAPRRSVARHRRPRARRPATGCSRRSASTPASS